MDVQEIERRLKLIELKEREIALKERELAYAKEAKKEMLSSPRKCIDCKGTTKYYAMDGDVYCSLHKPKSYPTSSTKSDFEKLSIFDADKIYSLGIPIVTPQVERYVDNDYNRKLGRSGKIMGTSVDKKDKVKTYTDNDYNRKLGRVGKIIGTAVESKKTKIKGYTRSDGVHVKSHYRK